MSKIKMNDIFELPVIDNGLNNLVTEHYDETKAAILAINSYDDNQKLIDELAAGLGATGDVIVKRDKEIAQLKALLNLSEAKHDRLVDENNELKSQVELIKSLHDSAQFDIESLFRQQPQNFEDGSYLIDGESCFELGKAIHLTPRQCLANVKADAVKSFGRDIGLYDTAYDDQEYIEITRHSVSEYIDKIQEAANEKSNHKN